MKAIVSRPNLGTDPEFFIFAKTNDGYRIISADKVLNGKDNIEKTGHSCGVFFDGFQAEMNPNENRCRETVIKHMRDGLIYIHNKAKEKYKGVNIVFAPLATIDIKKRDTYGVDNECMRFGCAPDDNIYSEEAIRYPNGKRFLKRFSGGHIHLGFSDLEVHTRYKDTPDKLIDLIKLLDSTVGVSSIALSQGDGEKIRRKWYGKAGTFRIQPHGLEYRTLSSYWTVSPIIASLIIGMARDALTLSIHNHEDEILDKLSSKEVIDVINKTKIDKAREIFKEVISPMYEEYSISNSPLAFKEVREFTKYLMEKGCDRLFNPYKMLHYWDIKKPCIYENFNTQNGVRKFVKDIKYKRLSLKQVMEL